MGSMRTPTHTLDSEVVTIGGKSAKITRHDKTANGQRYPSYRVRYWQNGKRLELTAPTIEEARKRAKDALKHDKSGSGHVMQFSPRESANITAAVEKLQGIGVPLLSAVSQFVAAHQQIKGEGTIAEAVAFFVSERERRELKPILAPDLVVEFLAAKKSEGLSDEYQKDISRRLELFKNAFRVPLSSIQTDDLAAWLRTLKAKGRNFNNYRNALTTLFSYGRDFNYLSRDKKTEAELLPRMREAVSEIGIYTPEQIRKILEATPERMIPAVAIGAFAGLRTMEILRLEWHEVNLKTGRILVAAAKAKTAQRRLVPISPNLAEWLAPFSDAQGRVTPPFQNLGNLSRSISAVCRSADVPMVNNGLRHSFASYRLENVKSADQVALEMGNSPRKLFQNYRELVTPKDARQWFGVRPKKRPSNIIHISTAA